MKSIKGEYWAKFTSDMGVCCSKESAEDDSEQEKTSERVRAN